jgi:hypothetical protein
MATSARRRRASWDASWPMALAVWLLLVLFVVAVFVVARRSSGALTAPLQPEMLVGCGVVLAALSIGIRSLACGQNDPSVLRDFWRIAPTAGVILIAVAVSLPGSHSGGVFGLWLLVVLGEIAAQLIAQARLSVVTRQSAEHSPVLELASVARVPGRPSALDEPVPEENDEIVDEDSEQVWQRSTRSRDENGQEFLSGWLRVDFAIGERTRFAHVSFCPPLARAPNCEVELLDEDAVVTASVAQVLPQGARFELRLALPAAELTSVALEWVAYDAEPADVSSDH